MSPLAPREERSSAEQSGFCREVAHNGLRILRHATRRFRQCAGSVSISDNSRHASELGWRSPCSHDRTVDGLTPREAANAAWLIGSIFRTRHMPWPCYSGGGPILQLHLRAMNRGYCDLPTSKAAASWRNPPTICRHVVRVVGCLMIGRIAHRTENYGEPHVLRNWKPAFFKDTETSLSEPEANAPRSPWRKLPNDLLQEF